MSDNDQDKDFDLAAFLLAGNIMVTLVEKGVIDMREACSIIRETQSALKNSGLYKKKSTKPPVITLIASSPFFGMLTPGHTH